MRKLIALSLLILAGMGCKYLESQRYEKTGPPRTSPPMLKDDFTTNEIERMADAVVNVRTQLWAAPRITLDMGEPPQSTPAYTGPLVLETEMLPLPPGLPPQMIVKKKKGIMRVMSAPLMPDKYVVVRWDGSADPFVTYRLHWMPRNSGSEGSFELASTKLDVVSLFKQQQVTPGWYDLTIEAVNGVFLNSDPVTAVTLLWLPYAPAFLVRP